MKRAAAVLIVALIGGSVLAPLHNIAASPKAPVIVAFGDSLTSGLGLPRDQAFPAQLQAALAARGSAASVIDAGVSGDTAAAALSRLDWALPDDADAVIIELGGNDALRGGNLDATRANLDAMVAAVQAARAKPLIVGMKVPPNYGAAYARRFDGLFVDVAKARRAPVVPYVFEGFGEDLAQFQPDRIHPTAAAQGRILDNVWPALAPLLRPR